MRSARDGGLRAAEFYASIIAYALTVVGFYFLGVLAKDTIGWWALVFCIFVLPVMWVIEVFLMALYIAFKYHVGAWRK